MTDDVDALFTRREADAVLAASTRVDPLRVVASGVTAAPPGAVSFDDRTYLRLIPDRAGGQTT